MAEDHEMKMDANYPFSQPADPAAGSQGQQPQSNVGIIPKRTTEEGGPIPLPQKEPEAPAVKVEPTEAPVQPVDQTAPVEPTAPPAGDPKDAIIALRRENQQLKEQMSFIAGQQAVKATPPPQNQPDQKADFFKDFDDDDVVTVADMKRVLQKQSQAAPAAPAQATAQPGQQPGQPDVRELQIQIQHSDYQQEIQKIPTILQQAPQFASAIRNSENPFLTAYTLAKGFQTGAPAPTPGAQIIDNLAKPGSPSQATGGGGVSRENYFSQLSESDLEKEIARVKRGG